jgi:leucyl aminopeptidase
VTTTLQTSQEAPRDARADVIVIGVTEGPDGPVLAPGADDINAALGGNLAETLGTLGATGKAEEVTKIASSGRLNAPLIAAVGIGAANGSGPFDGEVLRRAAGAAVRALSAAKPGQIALGLPARDAAETEAVALGALLGSYVFGRYTGKQAETELILLGDGNQAAAAAAARAQVLAEAMTLARDLVNTGPSDLFPATFAAEAERVAGASGLDIEVLDERALA